MLLIQAHRAEEKNIEISEALAAQANVRFKADDNARLKDQVLDSFTWECSLTCFVGRSFTRTAQSGQRL